MHDEQFYTAVFTAQYYKGFGRKCIVLFLEHVKMQIHCRYRNCMVKLHLIMKFEALLEENLFETIDERKEII